MFQKFKKRKTLSCLAITLIAICATTLLIPAAMASSEIVGSDYHYGTQLGISEVLYKDIGEQDPNYDYYTVKVLLADIMYQNDPWTGPLKATIRIAVPLSAVEPPGNHQPQAGFVGSQSDITFGFEGISFNMKIPAEYISYSTSTDANFRYFDWTIDGIMAGFSWWFIFEDYAEASVGIRVAQGSQPDVWASGWAAWYTFYGLVFTYNSQESYSWLHVTAPGDSPPGQTPALPPTLDTPQTVHMQPTKSTADQIPAIPPTLDTPSTISMNSKK